MNRNFISIIVNSELNYMSCLKSEFTRTKNNVFFDDNHKAEVKICEEKYKNATETYTEVKNCSDKEFELNQISSAFVEIENKGKLNWYDENKYIVHFCRCAWLGEGQWQTSSLRDLGLYQTYDMHQHNNYIAFSSRGSQTTARYYPLIMIEDKECGEIHFFEINSSSSWYIEICMGYDEKNEETLYVFLSGGCEKNDGWYKKVLPGETYRSKSAVYGTVCGGFEEAVEELTQYKRTNKSAYHSGLPVIFNDYMNCLWAMPNYEKEIKLIEAASDAGVEIYCFDSGWQKTLIDDSVRNIGDWEIADNRFSPHDFKYLIDYVKSKGMLVGAWLEVEGIHIETASYPKYKKLTRRGNVIGCTRAFLDFRCKEVRDKIESVFDKLYALGIRYIKNDYNQTIGIGADDSDSLSEGLRENQETFLEFIDYIKNKYTDLIIENCGSGGMRCDNETLSHFDLQSTSDQEVYTCNPSIICGILACVPPEKAGNWSYPYPVRFNDRNEYKVFDDDYSDGKQTVFNMINSMMGRIILSGRIDECDEYNMHQIKTAISVYKSIREDYENSYPIYPDGTFRIGDRGIFTVGLLNKKKKAAYIAVWKINTNKSRLDIDLSKYGNVVTVERLYPDNDDYSFTVDQNTITASFPTGNCAVLFRVEF